MFWWQGRGSWSWCAVEGAGVRGVPSLNDIPKKKVNCRVLGDRLQGPGEGGGLQDPGVTVFLFSNYRKETVLLEPVA